MANTETQQTSGAIINLFKNKFASKLNSIYVNSLKREVNFREVSVNEQKSLSKTMITNENRKDIVYDTQCALINHLCLENDETKLRSEAQNAASQALPDALQKEGLTAADPKASAFIQRFTNSFIQKYIADHSFDIYRLTEFDRIRILMEIYQNNYYNNEIKYTCKECGAENIYKLDFQKIIDKFNDFDLTDKTFRVEDNQYVYNFILNYPMVKNVSLFYKTYAKKYRGMSDKDRNTAESLGNIDYINLYIKQIELIDKATNEKTVADFTLMTYSEIESLIAMFPQNIIFSEDNGVFRFIAKEFIDKINSVFQYEKCLQCGAETKEGMGSVLDFF